MRRRLPHILTSHPFPSRGSGAGLNLIAGCDSKLSASFAKTRGDPAGISRRLLFA